MTVQLMTRHEGQGVNKTGRVFCLFYLLTTYFLLLCGHHPEIVYTYGYSA